MALAAALCVSASVCAALAPGQKMAVEALIKQFAAPEFETRQKAVDRLVEMGPDVVPVVKEALAETTDAEVKTRCEMVIRGIALKQPFGKERLEAEAILRRFADPDETVREEAVQRLLLMKTPILPLVRKTLAETTNAEVKACCERVIRELSAVPSPTGRLVPLPAGGEEKDLKEHVFGDFEGGTCDGWGGWCMASLTVVEDARAHGRRWMRMDLSDNRWPGMGVSFGSNFQDWSRYRAVRFSIFNPHDFVVRLNVTSADAQSSYVYETRYTDDDGISLQPGANDLEVPISALKSGSPGCRGLDVRRLTYFTLFVTAGPGQPHTLYVDNVRLVPAKTDTPVSTMLADFEGKGTTQWNPAGTGALSVEKRADGAGSALKVSFPDGPGRSGVEFTGFEGDWLSHDILSMDILCPKGQRGPRQLDLAFTSSGGRPFHLTTGLAEGLNRVRFPLDLAGYVSLGRVSKLTLVYDGVSKGAAVFVDNVRIERRPGLVSGGCVVAEVPEPQLLTIDFGGLDRSIEGVADQFGVIAWVPLASGGARGIHGVEAARAAPESPVKRYSLPPGALDGMKPGATIEVWGRMRVQRQWYWARKEIVLKAGEPATLEFDETAAFGCEATAAAP